MPSTEGPQQNTGLYKFLRPDPAGERANQRANQNQSLHRVTAQELARRLALWNTEPEIPLYLQLTNRLSVAIEHGELSRGALLPSERDLARVLSVSRRTVTAAYDQLRSLGRVASRTGVGTWCTPPFSPHARDRQDARLETHVQHLWSGPSAELDLTIGSPFGHPLVSTAREEVRGELEALLRHSHGYQPAGLYGLREEICGWFAERGVPTEPDQLVVTSGAAQALWLAATVLDAGAGVTVENPTSPTMLSALRGRDLRLRKLPADPRGMAVERIGDDLPDTVFVSPSYLNPSGAHLSADRCRRLAGLARNGSVLVVEDLALSDIRLDGPAPRTVAALAPGGQVLSIGSMSKLYWGGLRVGWIRGPRSLIGRIVHHKGIMDLGTSPDLQLQAAWLLRHRDDVLADRIPQLRTARDELAGALEALLPAWRWELPDGGLSLWAELPEGEAGPLLQQAQRRGISVLPGSAFDLSERDIQHLRLPYVHQPGTYREIVRRLADCRPGARRRKA